MSSGGQEATFDAPATIVNNVAACRCGMAAPKIEGPTFHKRNLACSRPLMRDWSDPVTATEVVKLYGTAWRVYVRIARLALEEQQIKYSLVEVDVFAETGVPQEHLKRQT